MIRPRFGNVADESQISIRGSGLRNNYHLRGLTLLLDGFPLNNADGFGDFEAAELLATKRVEVYKGANAFVSALTALAGQLTSSRVWGKIIGLLSYVVRAALSVITKLAVPSLPACHNRLSRSPTRRSFHGSRDRTAGHMCSPEAVPRP